MRETLTFIAGLLLVLLVVALFGPYAVDWRDYRGAVGRRLTLATGVPIDVAGGIGVRFLPTPRLALSDVRVGPWPKEGGSENVSPAVTVEQLDLEFSPGALLRGQIRLVDAKAEGAVVTIPVDAAGGLTLPWAMGHGHQGALSAALDNARISRSEIRLRHADGSLRTIGPISLSVSAPQLTGPWRIEGEVAGQSVRLVTGETEAVPAAGLPVAAAPGSSRTRARMTLGAGSGVAVLDGFVMLEGERMQVFPGFEGALIVTLADDDNVLDPAPGRATISGRLKLSRNVADISGLTILLADNALRLEGEGRFALGEGSSSLTLKTRRLVPLTAIEPVRRLLSRVVALDEKVTLPEIALRLDADQVQVGSEETGETSLRGRLGRNGLNAATLDTTLAGARLGFTGRIGDLDDLSGAFNLNVADTRRLALVLRRVGLDARLADAFSELGKVDLRADGALASDRFTLKQAVATVPGGRLEASGSVEPGRLSGAIRLENLDLGRLPELTALGGDSWPQEARLMLTLPRLRAGSGPPGEAEIEVLRRNGIWQPGAYAASGFGGLTLTGMGEAGTRDSGAARVSGRIASPKADVLVALAGPLLPPDLRQRLAVAAPALSPVELDYRLERRAGGAIALEATGLTGRARLRGTFATGASTEFDLDMTLPDRSLLFQQAGLPRPAGNGPGQFTFRREPGTNRVVARLAGPGLSISVSGHEAGGFDVSTEASAPGMLLPDSVARQMPEGAFSGTAKLTLADDAAKLAGLDVRIGGASATGELMLSRDGAVTGSLVVPALSLPALTGLAAATSPTAGAIWNSGRFLPPASGPSLALSLRTPVLRFGADWQIDDAGLELIQAGDGLTLDAVSGRFADGRIGGRLSVRRDGGLVSMSGHLMLDAIASERITAGEVSGRLSGRFEFGGSGESPARLVAGLGGSGEFALTQASVSRLDPSALPRILAATSDAAAESDAARLSQRLAPALAAAPWPAGSPTLALTMAAGVIRLQPLSQATALARAEFAGTLDLRTLSLDMRALLSSLAPVPPGWQGGLPQMTLRWRGPLASYRREIDPAPLSNALAARALAREIERVEAFESDIRERSFFARRLRAEREMREAERRAAEFERLADIQRILDEQKQREAEREAALTATPAFPVLPVPNAGSNAAPAITLPFPALPPPPGFPAPAALPPAPR